PRVPSVRLASLRRMPSASTIEIPLLYPAGENGSPSSHDARAAALNRFLRDTRAEPGVRSAEVIHGADQALLRAQVDHRLTSVAWLGRLARRAGLGFRERWARVVLGVQGMVSRQSEEAIEAGLAGLPNVRASASYTAGAVRIEFDRASCQLPDIALRLGRM